MSTARLIVPSTTPSFVAALTEFIVDTFGECTTLKGTSTWYDGESEPKARKCTVFDFIVEELGAEQDIKEVVDEAFELSKIPYVRIHHQGTKSGLFVRERKENWYD